MNKWAKIEALINQLIETFLSFLGKKSRKLAPKKLVGTVQQGKGAIDSKKQILKERLKKLSTQALGKAKESQKLVLAAQTRIKALSEKLKNTNLKELPWRKIFIGTFALLSPFLLKFKNWWISLRPGQIASVISLSAVGVLTSVNFYVQSNKIQEKSRTPASELAEEVEQATEVSRRPAYFRKKEKQFLISNITIPTYSQPNSPVKKLVIDFTIESSNKYIKEYLWQNPHLVHDILNSEIEPVLIKFPLEETDGKIILQKKIKKDLDKLLKKLNIKGEIKQVHVHTIIAG